MIMQGFGGELKQAHILVNGESGSTYRRNVKTFFRQNLSKGSMTQLSYRDSTVDNLVRLAFYPVDLSSGKYRPTTPIREANHLWLHYTTFPEK